MSRLLDRFLPINVRIELFLFDLDLRLVHQPGVRFAIHLAQEDPRAELAAETTLGLPDVSLVVALAMLLQVELPIESCVTVFAFERQLALVVEDVHPNCLSRFERLRTERTRHDGTDGVIPADVLLKLSQRWEQFRTDGAVQIGTFWPAHRKQSLSFLRGSTGKYRSLNVNDRLRFRHGEHGR